MTYDVSFKEDVRKELSKVKKKDKVQFQAVSKKIKQISENPRQFKPLKKPLEGYWRVQVGHFVVVYKIDDLTNTVEITRYRHHDDAY